MREKRPGMMTWRSASRVLLMASVSSGCTGPGQDGVPADSDMSQPAPTSVSRDGAFMAAAEMVIEFLQGGVEFGALSLSDTVTLYLAPESGGGVAKAAASHLRDRSSWRIPSHGGQTYVLVPPASLSGLTTRFGRHMKCFEYDLAKEFPELARFPHVGTRLEPNDFTSCLQTWNLTLVFEAHTLPPKLAALVYDQWEW
jgi:hypothetical protein